MNSCQDVVDVDLCNGNYTWLNLCPIAGYKRHTVASMTPNIRTKLRLRGMRSGMQWYWRSRTIRRTYTNTTNPCQRKALPDADPDARFLKNINSTQWITWTIQTFTNRKENLCHFYQPNQGCLCYLIFRFLLTRRLIALSKLKGGGKYNK